MSIRSILLIFILLGVVACCAGSIAAQERTNSQPPASSNAAQNQSAPTSSKPNDLEITANVTARELRFEVVPNPEVEFTGKPERDTVWEAERQNLPRPVQPGVTYRNIGIQLKISSVFADIDRIVAEALGETPLTDDTPKEKATPQQSAQPATNPSATTAPVPRGKP